MEQIKKKSIKYPFIFFAGYLAVQSFLIFNILLYAVHGLHLSTQFGNAVYTVVWSLQAILAVFVVKFSGKWGYKESVVLAMVFQIFAFTLLSVGTKLTFMLGASAFGVGATLAVSQAYIMLSSSMTKDYNGRYNIFLLSYVIMNAAAFVAGVISGFSKYIGFSDVFKIGAVLSFFLLLFVIFYFKKIESFKGSECYDQKRRAKSEKIAGFIKLFAIGIVVLLILIGCMFIANYVVMIVMWAMIIAVAYIIFEGIRHKGAERKKIFVFAIITIVSMVFWTAYNIYAALGFVSLLSRVGQLHGLAVQDVVSVDALVISTIGAVIAIVLIRLEKKGVRFNPVLRSIIGLIFLGIAFCIPVIGFHVDHFNGIEVIWMIIAIGFCALGEIFIGSVGTAIAGECSTKKLEGLFIAMGFVIIGGTSSFATYFSDWMIKSKTHTIVSMSKHFSYTTGIYAIIAFSAAVVLIVLYKILTKWGTLSRFKIN